jgi:ABC-type bacteriocin/lantibiotic exporter with double-glycine peptidase domain
MMALLRLRREIPLDLVELAGRARVGLTARELVALSQRIGLPARILAIPAGCLEQVLAQISLPSIALVGTHYILIEEPPSAGVLVVVDPAIGRMRTPIARLARQWRGVMVVLGENTGAAPACEQP